MRIHLVDKPDLTQVNVHLGHAGTRNRVIEAVTLMNYALGGGGFEPSDEADRSERGLTYGIRSGFSSGERAGPFMITSFTRVDKVREVIDLSMRVLSEVKTKGLRKATRRRQGLLPWLVPAQPRDRRRRGRKAAASRPVGQGDDFISAYPKRLGAVTLGDQCAR